VNTMSSSVTNRTAVTRRVVVSV